MGDQELTKAASDSPDPVALRLATRGPEAEQREGDVEHLAVYVYGYQYVHQQRHGFPWHRQWKARVRRRV